MIEKYRSSAHSKLIQTGPAQVECNISFREYLCRSAWDFWMLIRDGLTSFSQHAEPCFWQIACFARSKIKPTIATEERIDAQASNFDAQVILSIFSRPKLPVQNSVASRCDSSINRRSISFMSSDSSMLLIFFVFTLFRLALAPFSRRILRE